MFHSFPSWHGCRRESGAARVSTPQRWRSIAQISAALPEVGLPAVSVLDAAPHNVERARTSLPVDAPTLELLSKPHGRADAKQKRPGMAPPAAAAAGAGGGAISGKTAPAGSKGAPAPAAVVRLAKLIAAKSGSVATSVSSASGGGTASGGGGGRLPTKARSQRPPTK